VGGGKILLRWHGDLGKKIEGMKCFQANNCRVEAQKMPIRIGSTNR